MVPQSLIREIPFKFGRVMIGQQLPAALSPVEQFEVFRFGARVMCKCSYFLLTGIGYGYWAHACRKSISAKIQEGITLQEQKEKEFRRALKLPE